MKIRSILVFGILLCKWELCQPRKQVSRDEWLIIWVRIDWSNDVTGDGTARLAVADAPRQIGDESFDPYIQHL